MRESKFSDRRVSISVRDGIYSLDKQLVTRNAAMLAILIRDFNRDRGRRKVAESRSRLTLNLLFRTWRAHTYAYVPFESAISLGQEHGRANARRFAVHEFRGKAPGETSTKVSQSRSQRQ